MPNLVRRAGPRRGPRVLGGGVEHGAGGVEPGGRPSGVEGLGLEPGQDPQGLRVALEAAARSATSSSAASPVWPKGGWPRSCARQAASTRSGSAAERLARVPGRSGRTQRVGEPGAREVRLLAGATTWVLPASRRSAALCSTRARSRSKAVRARCWDGPADDAPGRRRCTHRRASSSDQSPPHGNPRGPTETEDSAAARFTRLRRAATPGRAPGTAALVILLQHESL